MENEKNKETSGQEAEKLEALFKGFISLISNMTMQQLGKVANPLTGKAERNLDVAKAWIETLKMIKAKTKGNLNVDEEKFLDSNLSAIQMNYADEVQKGPDPPAKEEKAPEPEKQPTEAEE